MDNKDNMTWLDHFEELRKRIMWTLVVFVLSSIVGFMVTQPVIMFFKNASPISDVSWNVFSPWDSIRIYMNVAMLMAALITLPFALYQLWLFIKPGLNDKEQRASLLYIPFAFLLCIGGLLFGYYVVFPLAFKFTSFIAGNLELVETYGIAQYFAFMFNIMIPLALLFELPIVIMFLTKIRLLNPKRLRRFRKYAYFILLVVGALVTPPDVISALLVSFPMIILYEISVYLSGLVFRRQQALDAEREAELAS